VISHPVLLYPWQHHKQRLQSENNDFKTEREKLLGEVRTLRDGLRGVPTNSAGLEEKISQLEFRLNHESLSSAGGGSGAAIRGSGCMARCSRACCLNRQLLHGWSKFWSVTVSAVLLV